MAVYVHWSPIVYLLLLSVSFSSSNPVPQTDSRGISSAENTRSLQLCGSELSKFLAATCLSFPSSFDLPKISTTTTLSPDNNATRTIAVKQQIVEECCVRQCNRADLIATYCLTVKNQTMESVSYNKPEAAVAVVEVPLITTDPPNQAEYLYAVEYLDTDPLTLVPTYTSPEYSANHLLL